MMPIKIVWIVLFAMYVDVPVCIASGRSPVKWNQITLISAECFRLICKVILKWGGLLLSGQEDGFSNWYMYIYIN